MVNQLQGGKSPNWSLSELEEAGANIVIFSTPALFSAQNGMEQFFKKMKESGVMPVSGTVGMQECINILDLYGK